MISSKSEKARLNFHTRSICKLSELRAYLEASRLHICRFMGVLVVIVLYADDAALPADSVEDLQLLATNENLVQVAIQYIKSKV